MYILRICLYLQAHVYGPLALLIQPEFFGKQIGLLRGDYCSIILDATQSLL